MKTFPDRDLSCIQDLLSTIKDPKDVNVMLQAYNILKEPTIDQFLDNIIYSCIELQASKIYSNASEDDRNTFITSILTSKGWLTKDQTRRGKSYQGKSAGELDIFITLQNGLPFAVIEAFILDSLKISYVDLHLKKIFGYDTAGLKQNFIIVYASASNFESLWNKYYSHLKKVAYPYPLLECKELLKYPFSDIKIALATHNRQGQKIFLYHIMVNMLSSHPAQSSTY